jgi:hypothetical protein
MLPNTEKLYKGKTTIRLSTSNAGNTQATISNLNVAAKDLGTLGRSGEARNDIDFNRDTQFAQGTN